MDVFMDVTIEFLSVAFHNILFYSSIYPNSAFETRKKYGIVVYRCVHPDVNKYLDKFLHCVASTLQEDELQRVEFCITDLGYKAGMKFIFDFERMEEYDETSDAYLVRCEQELRAFCLKLATVSIDFYGLPAERTFTIDLYVNESTEIAVANNPELGDFPLIASLGEDEQMDHIWPLRRFSIRHYHVDTYIELPKPWSFCS